MDDVVTCLFWNMNRRNRPDLLGRLAAETRADVIALAEPGFVEAGPTLEALRQVADPAFGEPPADTPHLHVFAHRLSTRRSQMKKETIHVIGDRRLVA